MKRLHPRGHRVANWKWGLPRRGDKPRLHRSGVSAVRLCLASGILLGVLGIAPAVSATVVASTASAPPSLKPKPLGYSLEVACGAEAYGSSVVVVLKASGMKPVEKTVRCNLWPHIERPLIDVVKAKRHGREGTTRLPFTASIGGKSWHFVAKYIYFRGREIPQSNFDDWVNTCINDNLHVYARGGKLYCYKQPSGYYDLTRP